MASLIFRRTRRGPGRTRITYGTGGVSASRRVGRLTVSTTGSLTVRILKGMFARVR